MVDDHLRCCLGCFGSHWGRTIAGKGAVAGKEVVAGMRAAEAGKEAAAVAGKQEAVAEVVDVVVVVVEVAGTAPVGSKTAAVAGAEGEPEPEARRRDSWVPWRSGSTTISEVGSSERPAMDYK